MFFEQLQKVKKNKIGRLGLIILFLGIIIAFVFGNKKGAIDSISIFSVKRISIDQADHNLKHHYDDFDLANRLKLLISTKYVFPQQSTEELDEKDFLRMFKISFITNKDTAIYYINMDNAIVITNRFSGVYKSEYMLETIINIVQTYPQE